MNTNDLTITLIVVAAVVYAIIRQVTPQRVKIITFVVFPVIAAYEAYKYLPKPMIPLNQVFECAIVMFIGVLAGAIQAANTRVYYKDNVLYMHGGFISLITWIGVMFFRFFIELIFQGFSLFTNFNSFEWILWAAIAVTFGSKNIILYFKNSEIGLVLAEERAKRRNSKKC